jgi:hypothetical protein
MFRKLKPLAATGCLAVALSLGCMSLAPVVWAATAEIDAAQVKLQSTLLPGLRIQAEKASGYTSKDLELKATAHQITITIIGSVLNKGSDAERLAQASKIVSAVAAAIADKPEFSQIPVIHLDYVTAAGHTGKVIQKIDFFQNPAGVFVLHKT